MKTVTLVALTMLVLVPVSAAAWSGMVVQVTDGDTILVWRGEKNTVKVRLFGIDAPERDQVYGAEAAQFLRGLVLGRIVDVGPVKRDRYDRLVAWVSVDGQDVSESMLCAGWAWWYKKYAPEHVYLGELQEQARNDRLGLWMYPEPVPPWAHRQNKRNHR